MRCLALRSKFERRPRKPLTDQPVFVLWMCENGPNNISFLEPCGVTSKMSAEGTEDSVSPVVQNDTSGVEVQEFIEIVDDMRRGMASVKEVIKSLRVKYAQL